MFKKLLVTVGLVALTALTSLGNVCFQWISAASQALDANGVNLPTNSTVLVFISTNATINFDPRAGLLSSYGDDVFVGATHTTIPGRYVTPLMVVGAAGAGLGSYVGCYTYIVLVNTPYYDGITPESIPIGTQYGISSLSSALSQYDSSPPGMPLNFTDASDGDAIIRTSITLFSGASVLAVTPTVLTNVVSQGESAVSQTFDVWNAKMSNTMSYTVSDNAAWLAAAPSSGTTTNGSHATVTLGYNTSGLVAGTYGATVTVSAASAANSPCTVAVTLCVTSPPAVMATHACIAYPSPGTAHVSCTVAYAANRSLLSLLWRPTLPAGWALTGASGAGTPQVRSNEVVFTGTLTNSPLVFEYQVSVPAGQTGSVAIGGEAEYTLDGLVNPTVTTATPDPLLVTSMRTLTVQTAHGVAVPSGAIQYNYGTPLTNCVTSPETVGDTQYVCTGWAMTGNDPQSGTDVVFAMTLTNNATLTWLWQMQYRFTAAAEEGGSAIASRSWYAPGATATATATATVGFVFTQWTWDAGSSSANPLQLTLDRPYVVTAHFAVDPALIRATPSCAGYRSPSTNTTIACTFAYPASRTVTALVWQPALPAGWTLVSGDTNIVVTGPFTNNPLAFSFAVQIPGDAAVTNDIGGTAFFQLAGMNGPRTVAAASLSVSRYHSADYRTAFWDIDGTEVNRVLSYWRAGAYHIDAAGYDGYASGSGATAGGRHSSDFQAPYWVVDAVEAATTLAYWRAGGYATSAGSADGYAAIAGGSAAASKAGLTTAQAMTAAISQTAPTGYDPGDTVTITNRFEYVQPLLTLTWQPVLPAGWTLVSATGDGDPELQHGALLWTGPLPPSPICMTYTVRVPLTEKGPKTVTSTVGYYLSGMAALAQASPTPAALTLVPNDADGDGIPDAWARHYAGDPAAMLPNEDSDHDGMSNLQEFLAGTDPLDAESKLDVHLTTAGDGVLLLTWPSVLNRFYAVSRGTNLSDGLSAIATNIPATPPENTFREYVPAGPVFFYKVNVEP